MNYKKTEISKETIKKENEQVLEFIKKWQKLNLYKSENLRVFNEEFEKDFRAFLNDKKISNYTKDFFLK